MSIRKALAFAFLDRYAGLALSILSSIVIARLLTPADIGVFSVTMVLTSLAATFRDLGAGQYLVQEKELTTERIRAVWALLLGIGAALGLLTFAAAYPVAHFYAEPRMRDILYVLAGNYLVNPVASLTYAWLMRTMRYDALAVMRFSSALVGSVVSIGLAWKGFGPISLAWGALANTTTNAVAAVLLRPKDFPWLPSVAELKRVLSFGYRITLSGTMDTLATAMPELALGKFQSMTSVGLFSRANGLVALFYRAVNDAVNSVALSMFSKSVREGRGLAEDFVRANAYMTALAWSFSTFLVLMAFPLVRVLYGPQWDGAVQATRILGVGLACAAPAALCYQALVALGQVKAMLRAAVVAGGLTSLAAAAGAWLGLWQTAAALCIASTLCSCVWLGVAQRHIGFMWRDLGRSMRASALVALGAALVPGALVLAYGWEPLEHQFAVLASGGVGMAVGGLLALMWVRHPLADELKRLRRGA